MDEFTESHDFSGLTPDTILDAIETTGIQCDGRLLALNSYENRVYQIGVEDGPFIVAKFYRPNRWTDAAIIEEHQFMMALADEEIPVIPPQWDRDNQSLLKHQQFRFALYPCRGGRTSELDNSDHLEQIGRLVGRIHATSALNTFKHRATLSIERFSVKPSEFLLQNQFIPDYLIESYHSLTQDLIKQIRTAFEHAGNVPYIRLHGDFHPSNTLWTDSGPHIVDFDDAIMGPAIQDLWMFLSGDRDYMTARLGDLLEGYTQFYEFNPSELHLIEALRTLRIINYAGWLAQRWSDPAFPLAFPWFNQSRYWDNHILTLREQAALMNEGPLIWD